MGLRPKPRVRFAAALAPPGTLEGSFDATDQIILIDKPVLMIAGSKADSLYMTEDAFAKATGMKDKELFKIDGATHIETYWVPKYVDGAMKKLTEFFARSLGE